MPVYVTGAHVTLGDGSHKRPHSKNSETLKRPFYFKHTCKTPYCCRILFVIFAGLILVGTGAIMTLIGYKPALILPWYTVENNNTVNETRTNSERKVLGEPGPFRIMVYTGPIIMGVGFFGVMMAVVLFCEIKDRYLMAILPTKGEIRKIKKDMLYDMIINEFRKNYFRGIEVPIKTEEQKRHGFKKWSFSLSASGSSFISFARRHSHDLYKFVKRKHKSKEKWENATFPKRSTPDTWMKTSSLPNIKQKSDTVELEILPYVNPNIIDNYMKDNSKDVKRTTDVEDKNAIGVDNFAYNDSPSNKKTNVPCKTDERLQETYTTAVVHNELTLNEAFPRGVESALNSQSEETIKDVRNSTSSNIESAKKYKDISLNNNKALGEGHRENNLRVIMHDTNNDDLNAQYSECKRVDPEKDFLGMTSDTSSLTLSWEGAPLEWSDARRNTEPCALFQLRLDSDLSESNDDNTLTTNHDSTTTTDYKHIDPSSNTKRNSYRFKTVIRVFHSDTSLSESQRLSNPVQNIQDDSQSIDSLELTDEMLKNFEMAKISHI